MKYSVEVYCLRPLPRDDVEMISRYERVNRRHLQPWEPLRDEQYFTTDNASARVEQQVNSMQSENCWRLGGPYVEIVDQP